jgi:hypothetical protein
MRQWTCGHKEYGLRDQNCWTIRDLADRAGILSSQNRVVMNSSLQNMATTLCIIKKGAKKANVVFTSSVPRTPPAFSPCTCICTTPDAEAHRTMVCLVLCTIYSYFRIVGDGRVTLTRYFLPLVLILPSPISDYQGPSCLFTIAKDLHLVLYPELYVHALYVYIHHEPGRYVHYHQGTRGHQTLEDQVTI